MGNMIESLLDHAEFQAAARETFLPDDTGVCYFYHRSKRYNVTVAYRRRHDNTVAYGAAFCRPEDQFVKRQGRRIAIGRMDTYDHILTNPGSSRWEVHEAILDALTRLDLVPYAPENFRP
jgi:hypothetical protein